MIRIEISSLTLKNDGELKFFFHFKQYVKINRLEKIYILQLPENID